MEKLNNKWILVTGASSGLGLEMSLQLAIKQGANLILVARREEKLIELKSEIEGKSEVQAELIKADLTSEEDIKKIITFCLSKEGFFGAILNAGRTYLGEHVNIPPSVQSNIIALNLLSTITFTNAFVKHFEATKEEGTLMVISSLAAMLPAPYQSLYSGTKAFLTNFYHSLSHELKNPKFQLSVFSPGGIRTEMTEINEFKDFDSYLMPVNEAAKEAVHCFVKQKHNHIPGFGNRMGIAVLGMLPKRIFSKLMGKKYYKSIQKNKEE